MHHYSPKEFTIPKIEGISQEQIDLHITLYKGYVAHLNKLYEQMEELQTKKVDVFVINELRRRIGFEFAGMRNHETYFGALENGPSKIQNGILKELIIKQFGSCDAMIKSFAAAAKTTRGVGWCMLKFDPIVNALHITWTVDHELGNIPIPTILGIDMWEHAYMHDYSISEKGSYVDAYIKAVDWDFVAKELERVGVKNDA